VLRTFRSRVRQFIVKRGLIPREALQPFIDLWWEQPPVRAAGLSPDGTSGWLEPGTHWPKAQRWATSKNWLGDQPWPEPEDERPAGAENALFGEPFFRLKSLNLPRQARDKQEQLRKRAISAGTIGAGVGRQPHGCSYGGNGWKWHGLGHDPAFVSATSAHPNMLHVVEALLGAD